MFKPLTKIFVSAVLFVFGSYLLFSYVTKTGFGFFNFVANGDQLNITETVGGELLMGTKVSGIITSKYPNLGIVSVRFNNHYRDSKDVLIFRIKEVGQDNWYYQSRYATDQFLPEELFPFGFPVITGSAGRKYLFEIKSTAGATGSSIFVGEKKPVYASINFVDKEKLYSNKVELVQFAFLKMKNIFAQSESLQMIFIFYSPLIFYLAYLLTLGFSYHFLALGTFFVILWEVFYFQGTSDLLVFSTTSLIILQLIRFKYESKVLSAISILFLTFCFTFGIFGYVTYAEKIISWLYIFLSLAVGLTFYEMKIKNTQILKLSDVQRTILSPQVNKNSVLGKVISRLYKPLVIFLSLYFIYKTGQKIVSTYHSYRIFFPENKLDGGLFLYLLIILTSLFFVCGLVYKSTIKFIFLVLAYYVFVGIVSNKLSWFQHLPKVLSITPQTTNEAWVDVTINGKNFQSLPFVGKVTLAGEVQVENVHYWSNEKIIFRTNPATTKTGDVCIQTLSKGNSNCLPFEYNFNKKK